MKRLPRIHRTMIRSLSTYVATQGNGDRHIYTHWATNAINKASTRAFGNMTSIVYRGLLQGGGDVCLSEFAADVELMTNAAPLYNDLVRISITSHRDATLKTAERRFRRFL